MPKSDDGILIEEIGKAGSLGGSLGGGPFGKFSGGLGGRIGARFLPTLSIKTTFSLPVSPAFVVRVLTDICEAEGTVLSSQVVLERVMNSRRGR